MTVVAPDRLGDVLAELVRTAAAEAAGAAGDVATVLAAVGSAPDDAADRIRGYLDPPRLWSLLFHALLRVHDVDPEQCSVGIRAAADSWSSAMTLTYRPDAGSDARIVVGIAVADDGPVHGLFLESAGAVTGEMGDRGALHVKFRAAGSGGQWRWPFGAAVVPHAGSGSASVSVVWTPAHRWGDARAGVVLGPLALHVELATDPPHYSVDAGLGDGARPGVQARLSPQELLGLPPGFVSVAALEARYSPHIVVADDAPPRFRLGQG